MGRKIYIVPAGTPVDSSIIALADTSGTGEIVVGIPPALAGRFTLVSDTTYDVLERDENGEPITNRVSLPYLYEES